MLSLRSRHTWSTQPSANGFNKLGFTEDASKGAPICRWQHGQIKLDLMPLDEKILGFSNRWYKAAMDTANEFEIERDIRIRVVTAPYFCATKLEAFKVEAKAIT